MRTEAVASVSTMRRRTRRHLPIDSVSRGVNHLAVFIDVVTMFDELRFIGDGGPSGCVGNCNGIASELHRQK
jgi:hypothetical protein